MLDGERASPVELSDGGLDAVGRADDEIEPRLRLDQLSVEQPASSAQVGQGSALGREGQ